MCGRIWNLKNVFHEYEKIKLEEQTQSSQNNETREKSTRKAESPAKEKKSSKRQRRSALTSTTSSAASDDSDLVDAGSSRVSAAAARASLPRPLFCPRIQDDAMLMQLKLTVEGLKSSMNENRIRILEWAFVEEFFLAKCFHNVGPQGAQVLSSILAMRLNKKDLLKKEDLSIRLAWATTILIELGVGFGLMTGEDTRDIGKCRKEIAAKHSYLESDFYQCELCKLLNIAKPFTTDKPARLPVHIFEKHLDAEYECYCGETKKSYNEIITHFGIHPKPAENPSEVTHYQDSSLFHFKKIVQKKEALGILLSDKPMDENRYVEL